MRQVTFSQIRESVRTEYDLATFTTTTKPTLSQVNIMINKAAARLSGILVELYGEDYFTASTSLSATSAAATTTLPTDFYKLRQLIWMRDANTPYEVPLATIDDYTDDSQLAARAWTDEAPKYRFEGANVVRWLPRPSATYSVTCVYMRTPVDLSADGDTVDSGPGWEDFIVNDVCRVIAKAREEDPSPYLADRADAEARIRRQAPQRAPFAGQQVRDARGAVSRRDAGVWQQNGRSYGRWG